MDEREQARRPEQPERVARREQAVAGESIGQAKRVIDIIEQRVNEAYRIPLSKGMCVVEASALIDLISQLRIALPKAVVQAQDVLANREELIEEAKNRADQIANEADALHSRVVGEANHLREQIQAEADAYEKQTRKRAEDDAQAMIADANTRAEQILYAAQQQAQQMLDENEITRRAQAYALEVRDRAQQDADSIYNQACVHADKLLSGAAAALSRSANDLADMRDKLLGQDNIQR